MADLRWDGDDGFDVTGRRVACVLWGFDLLPGWYVLGGGDSGPAFFAPRSYWEALVAPDGRFEHVLVGSRPGRWTTKDEAKAAAEWAYRLAIARRPHDHAHHVVTGGATAHRVLVADPSRQVRGVLGHLRSLVRAWRTVYRSDRGQRGDIDAAHAPGRPPAR